MSETCRSCGAAVKWAQTENGKSMPVEADPGGNLVLVPAADPRAAPVAMVLRRPVDGFNSPRVEAPRWRSHFASCPEASQWRKPKEVSA